MENWVPEPLDAYIEAHCSPIDRVLHDLQRETHLKVVVPQMISSPSQGVFLRMLSATMQPRQILEIGTFTGYSAICLAAGLAPGGTLHTIDINEELRDLQERYLERAGLLSCTKLYTGNALDIIPQIDATFDLVFLDADKRNYQRYYELIFPRLRKGGIILADNVLWWGKVADPTATDKDTEALRAFNRSVQADRRVENVILPIRDGISMIRKLSD